MSLMIVLGVSNLENSFLKNFTMALASLVGKACASTHLET